MLMSNNQLNSKRLRRLAKKGDKNAASSARDESKSEKRKRQIGYAFLFIFGLGLSQFVLVVYSWFVPNYVRLSVDNPTQLKEVFFGGKPYLVLCNDGEQAVHSTFTEVSRSVSYSREFKTAILDCNQKLPSGKTTLERFQIKALPKKSKKHLALVFYNGNKKPKQVPFNYLSDTSVKESLLTWTKELVQLRYGRVTNEKTFQYCTKRKHGNVLLIVNGTLSDVNKRSLAHLMNEHRLLRFCTLNHQRYRLVSKSIQDKAGDGKMKRFIKVPKELSKGEALIVGLKYVDPPVEKSEDENQEKNKEDSSKEQRKKLAFKQIALLGEPPSPTYFLEQLKSAKSGADAVDNLKMKVLKGNPVIQTRKSYRKVQNKKYKRKRKNPSGESRNSETPKERRARLKREHLSKQKKKESTSKERHSGKAASGNDDHDDVSSEERQRLQRERELERRRAMDAEAKQHFAQGVDDEEEDEYDGSHVDEDEDSEIDLDGNPDEYDDEEDDSDAINLDELDDDEE